MAQWRRARCWPESGGGGCRPASRACSSAGLSARTTLPAKRGGQRLAPRASRKATMAASSARRSIVQKYAPGLWFVILGRLRDERVRGNFRRTERGKKYRGRPRKLLV